MEKKCYWCAGAVTSAEHVPPRNLFPEGYRNNLITVPSCAEHNNYFSDADEKVRFYLQSAESSKVALTAFCDKTLRGAKRPQSMGFVSEVASSSVQFVGNEGEILGGIYEAKGTYLQPYFEKITRGLYHFVTGSYAPLADVRYYSEQFFSHDDREKADFLNEAFITLETEIGKVSNDEVFSYRYILSDEFFTVQMCFYEGVIVYGLIKLN